MKNWKGFVAGVLVTVLAIGLFGTALATAGSRSVTADYNNIKVTLNGDTINLADANGAPVEPFAINGTTYLPVRAVANALGLDVGWDQTTATVSLSTKASASSGQVVMEKDGIKVTYMGIKSRKGEFLYEDGWDIKLKIENTTLKDYSMRVSDFSVNDIMAECSFSCDVAAGKTANEVIVVHNLEESGIYGPIISAEFKFVIYPNDNIMDWVESDVIRIGK